MLASNITNRGLEQCSTVHTSTSMVALQWQKTFFKRDDFLALASIFFCNLVRSSISSHSIIPWPGRALAYVLFLEKQVPGKFLMPSSQTNTFNEHSRLFQESLIMRLNIQNAGL